jgi:ATP-dependent RNA helicase DDX56/DBP9
MKHVPSYLMPRIAPVGGATLADGTAGGADGSAVNGTGAGSSSNLSNKYIPYKKTNNKNNNKRGGKKTRSGKRGDPLKSFKRK